MKVQLASWQQKRMIFSMPFSLLSPHPSISAIMSSCFGALLQTLYLAFFNIPCLTLVALPKHLKTVHSCKAVTIKNNRVSTIWYRNNPWTTGYPRTCTKSTQGYRSASLHLVGQACFRAGHTGVGQANKRIKIQLQYNCTVQNTAVKYKLLKIKCL